ncbi:nucleotide disphospho-sugar-binding domain-containing protein [Streptomyces sp. DW26H14]|uniref:nucleotide disphospho-sugar-binding domain-containing protein n=1 Tax=Streptomyces sp. DW26H14 TaxID=3435395 RepID=UPI00403E2014
MASAAVADGHEAAILTSEDLRELLAPFPLLIAGPPAEELVAETVRRLGGPWNGPGPGAAELFAGTRVDLTYEQARIRAKEFAPDLIVCDTLDFVGPMLAAELGTPWALHGVSGGLPPHFGEVLDERWDAQLARYGLTRTPRLAYVDPYPDLLHGEDAPSAADRLPVRIVPFDRSGAAYEPPEFSRPGARVLVTLGTSVDDRDMEREFATSLAEAGFNVLVTGPAPDGAGLGPAVRHIGFVPLARVLPDVDLVVSAGGTGTVLGALALGVPLVIRPVMADHPFNAARAQRLGAALTITEPGEAGAAARQVLGDPAFARAAGEVRARNAALPSPADVLRELETRLPGH